ncbi:uncharacterized protein LOC132037735 [Lycium ferocissimum]|uniref:uncharacterized protein LOC132037735 n=1 Tax=Lycium ferocissimum TaxID=112874 RepID=UPI002815BCF4|nr:uncharacterized protein LOC132037735 [Lycium ferocissimum]
MSEGHRTGETLNYPWCTCGKLLAEGLCTPGISRGSKRLGHPVLNQKKKVVSDHSPIVLECGNWEQKKASFKFENWWLKVEGFNELIQNWWNEFLVEGCPDYIFCTKLKMLKQKLKDWSKTTSGELTNRKNSLLNELAEIDLRTDQRELSEDEMMIRATVLVELEELAKNEESSWRQSPEYNG